MRSGLSRRHFTQSLLGASFALAGCPAVAAGKVLFGFLPDAATTPVTTSLLTELQGRYEPDLGNKLVYLPGNSGGVAIQAAQQLPADGSSVLLTPSTIVTLLPHLRELPKVDPMKDLIPVAAVCELTVAFAVGPRVPDDVKTLADYVRWVQQHPEHNGYGVPGLGTAAHFIGMSMTPPADAPLRAVAYKSLLSLGDDLKQGNLPAAFIVVSGVPDLLRHGQVRLLAVASEARWPGLPAVPTLRETGVSTLQVESSYGLFMPLGTPAGKVTKLRQAVSQVRALASIRNALSGVMLRPMGASADGSDGAGGADDYAAVLAREHAQWGELVKQYRFSIDS